MPAILIASLLTAFAAQAAPGDASARPAPAAPPAAVIVPVQPTTPGAPRAAVVVPVPASPAPGTPTPPTPPTPPYPASPSGPANGPVPVPALTPASPSTPAKPLAKLPAPKTPIEAAVQQVVMLERAGRPIGIGTLLNGDGRILTALSPLTHGNQIIARYPEGQLVPVKLSHSDRAWDLALLTPEGDTRRAGLRASREAAPAVGSKLHAVSYVRDKQLGASDITLKAKSTLRGGDSAQLPEAYELPFSPKASDIGAPLLDDKGEVVAIIARACSVTDKTGCTLAPYAAPVSAVRDFLRSVPMRRSPWVGVEVVAFDAGVARGVRVAGVAPQGPAANAGLRAGPPGVGDVVLAVDGQPVSTSTAFVDAVDSHGPSSPVRLTVLTEGRYREVLLRLSGPSDPAAPASAPGPAPARNDRVFRSNPSGPWPSPQKPTPVPNPYR